MVPETQGVSPAAVVKPAGSETTEIKEGGLRQARSFAAAALEIFSGKEETFAGYLSVRTYNQSAQPAWFQEYCWSLAQSEFSQVRSGDVWEATLKLMLSLKYSKPIQTWICRNIYQLEPYQLTNAIVKSLSEASERVKPNFTSSHYEQMGIPNVGILSDLASSKGREHPRAGTDSESQPVSDLLGLREKIDKLEAQKDLESTSLMLESLIEFNPTGDGRYALAAAAASRRIGRSIINYSLMTDILESFDIQLNEKHSSLLFRELNGLPVSAWKQHVGLGKLIELARHVAVDPTLVTHVSRGNAFSRYAYREDAVGELRLANQQAQERLRVRSVATGISSSSEPEVHGLAQVDHFLGSIESFLEEWEVDPAEKDLAPLQLARLAIARNISMEKLKRIFLNCDFDGSKVLAEIQPKPKASQQMPASSSPTYRGEVGLSLDDCHLEPFTFLLHEEQNKVPFVEWYQGLQKAQRGRVDLALTHVEDGLHGLVRKLGMREVDGQKVSLYELRLLKDGLRVYFRYLSDHRIVLLGGGGKSSQDRDIDICARSAIEYNGAKEIEATRLREWRIE